MGENDNIPQMNTSFETGELTKEATIRKIGIVQSEGDREVEITCCPLT